VDPENARAKLYLKDVLAAGNMYIDESQVKERERQSAVLDIRSPTSSSPFAAATA